VISIGSCTSTLIFARRTANISKYLDAVKIYQCPKPPPYSGQSELGLILYVAVGTTSGIWYKSCYDCTSGPELLRDSSRHLESLGTQLYSCLPV
jgi:hypothetical protein